MIMANGLKRTAKLAIIAYKDASGVDAYALLGEDIRVHADDAERFDRLNGQHGNAEPVLAATDEDEIPVDQEAGQGSTEDEEPLERPSNKAHLSDWQDYAEQEGVDLEHDDGKAKTKAELIAELSD